MNQPRNSNPILCYSMISLGVIIILFTIVSAFLLKDGIIDRVSKPLNIEGMMDGFEIDTIDRQIQFKEQSIRLEKMMSDDREKLKRETLEKLGKKSASNINSSNFEQDKTGRLKKLEDEKAALIVKKEELEGKIRAENARTRSWREWYQDNALSVKLFFTLITLGTLSLVFMRLTFFGAMPERNPLSLTDFERRCVLFLPLAIVFSAFGFFLFAFSLTLIY